MISAILPIPILFILKVFAYKGAFRFREVHVTYTTCAIIAGSPLALLVLGFLPVPFLVYFITIGLVVLPLYLTMKYTGLSLFPEAVLITIPIESVSWLVYAFVIVPLFAPDGH